MRKLSVIVPDASHAAEPDSEPTDARKRREEAAGTRREDAGTPAADSGESSKPSQPSGPSASGQSAEPNAKPAAEGGAGATMPPPTVAGATAPPPAAGTGSPFPNDPRERWPHSFDDAGVDEDDAGVPPPPLPRPQCSGKLGAAGNSTRSYGDRQFIVHIPPNADPNRGLPVIFVFHGAGGKGSDMQLGTNFDALGDMQPPAITVYPDGQAGNAPWNVGRNVCPPGNFVSTTADDVAYIDAMLDDIEQDQCLDRGRVFATGFSMGGYFTNELGCKLGRARLRAIAPHSGGTHSGQCQGGPLPVLLLHGDADSLINYRCGTQARDYWLERNGCSPEYDTWNFTGGQCEFHRGCPVDAPVVLCTFFGMDHTWAFPPMYDSSSLLIWAFFEPML